MMIRRNGNINNSSNRNRIPLLRKVAGPVLWSFLAWSLVVRDLAAGLDTIEAHSAASERTEGAIRGNDDDGGGESHERVWGAQAPSAEATKVLHTEEASLASSSATASSSSQSPSQKVSLHQGGADERGRSWGGSAVPATPETSKHFSVQQQGSFLKDPAETIRTNAANVDVAKDSPDGVGSIPPEKTDSKRVWGASDAEAAPHSAHHVADDVDAKRGNRSESSSFVHPRGGGGGGGSTSTLEKTRNKTPDYSEESGKVEDGGTHRMWGGQQQQDADSPPPIQPQPKREINASESTGETSSHIPFVASKKQQQQHNPPDGFTLAARVYTGDDKVAHFDCDEDQQCPITLPYFDCGASGSTTAALPVKHAYFRHSLSASTVWIDPDMHPVLAIALAPFRMELDSGESMQLKAGDVVLLEDSIRPGHRMVISENHNLSVLFVTLPQPHYHTGKQHSSLKKMALHKAAPCPTDQYGVGIGGGGGAAAANVRASSTLAWDARRLRMLALGTVALSISTLVADFLGKTAPLWLAVGVGGTCFVAGSTYGLTVAGDLAFANLKLWHERRRLENSVTSAE